MTLRYITLDFALCEGDKLMRLVRERGYSMPTKEEPYARKVLTEYHGASIKVDQIKERSACHVTIAAGAEGSIVNLVCIAVHDLQEAGLITGSITA